MRCYCVSIWGKTKEWDIPKCVFLQQFSFKLLYQGWHCTFAPDWLLTYKRNQFVCSNKESDCFWLACFSGFYTWRTRFYTKSLNIKPPGTSQALFLSFWITYWIKHHYQNIELYLGLEDRLFHFYTVSEFKLCFKMSPLQVWTSTLSSVVKLTTRRVSPLPEKQISTSKVKLGLFGGRLDMSQRVHALEAAHIPSC